MYYTQASSDIYDTSYKHQITFLNNLGLRKQAQLVRNSRPSTLLYHYISHEKHRKMSYFAHQSQYIRGYGEVTGGRHCLYTVYSECIICV